MTEKKPPSPQQIREWIETDKAFRVSYFEHNFTAFFLYHWGWAFMDFHYQWCDDFESGENLILKWFRSSRKTTIARWFAVWCIIYQKHDYIVVQSFEDVLSWAWVHQVAKMLLDDSIVADYWVLFPLETKKEDLAKKSVSNFEATNGVKIESKSMGQTLRGANQYRRKKKGDTEQGKPARPTLLFLEDIDVDKSVKNIEIIDANERKILTETIGAMDATKRQVCLLGNVITEDGVVPRFIARYKWKKKWRIREQALFDENWECVWKDVFTPEVIEQLRIDEGSGFDANYLLIPYVNGQTIIPRSLIKTTQTYPRESKVTIGIDPAFSLKTASDALAIVVTWHHWWNKYILACYELEGNQKQENIYRPFIKQVYKAFNASLIRIEANNGGELIWRQLKADELAVDIITATKDKITRLKEKEGDFTQGKVLFLPWTETLQERLWRFPNVKKDDIVDAMVYSLHWAADLFVWVF